MLPGHVLCIVQMGHVWCIVQMGHGTCIVWLGACFVYRATFTILVPRTVVMYFVYLASLHNFNILCSRKVHFGLVLCIVLFV